MSSPSYVAYTPKRHSTQTSISSLSQLHSQHSSSSSSSSSSTTTTRPSHSHSYSQPSTHTSEPPSSSSSNQGNGWLKSPQPRLAIPRPPLNNWTSTSSTTSTASYSSYSRSPNPPQSFSSRIASPPQHSHSPIPPNTLPYSPSPRPPTSPSPTPHASPQKHQGKKTEYEGGRMPFLREFQPVGVRGDRTEEFFKCRKKGREERKGEELRLERRLDKLIDLHFPPSAPDPPTAPSSSSAQPPTNNSFASTFSSFSSSLRSQSAKDLWRTSLAQLALPSKEIEREEQQIVKWIEDSQVKQCSICSATFGLITRKHHCRLCGRVVCFLPPTAPSPPPPPPSAQDLSASTSSLPTSPSEPDPPVIRRKERCSTFFTYVVTPTSSTTTTGKATEKERRRRGLVVEVVTVEQDNSVDALFKAGPSPGGAKEKEVINAKEKEKEENRKKVRVCRECLNTVLRNQLSTLPLKTPNWLKLYKVLGGLEGEIEGLLVEFQELAMGLQQTHAQTTNPSSPTSAPPPSAAQASSLRARLLTNLASYDTLSKRLLSLSSSNPSSELERLQRALGTRASIWLSDKLSLLRSLGSVEELSGKKKRVQEEETGEVKSLESLLSRDELRRVREKVGDVTGVAASENGSSLNGEAEGDGQLGVLLEQERLVKGYLEDANSRRQFEDAASLQASLDELRGEIERMRT